MFGNSLRNIISMASRCFIIEEVNPTSNSSSNIFVYVLLEISLAFFLDEIRMNRKTLDEEIQHIFVL